MSACECKGRSYNATVANAVNKSVEALTAERGSLSVLRNGGWEQWLRNTMLIRLDSNIQWGLTEAGYKKAKRTDLILYCRHCDDPLLAIETKTNFWKQSPNQINKRISEAVSQLEVFVDLNIPSYIVYTLTQLRGIKETPIVDAQNRRRTPSYKHFKTYKAAAWSNAAWTDKQNIHLPADHHVGSYETCEEECHAEIRAWVALVKPVNNNLRRLTFLNNNGVEMSLNWSRREEDNGRTNQNNWAYHK